VDQYQLFVVPAAAGGGTRAVPGQVHLNLAAQANVSHDVISKIETGERPPPRTSRPAWTRYPSWTPAAR
jgi:hypothetical protein